MGDQDEQKKKSIRDVRRFRRVLKATKDSIADEALYPQLFLDALNKDIKEAHKDAEDSTEENAKEQESPSTESKASTKAVNS